jgi:RNA recognition motif-containing protein
VEILQVTDVKVIRQRPSGQHAGYGFVEFASQFEAQNVLNNFNGRPITQHPSVLIRPNSILPCPYLQPSLGRKHAACRTAAHCRDDYSMEGPPDGMPCTLTGRENIHTILAVVFA